MIPSSGQRANAQSLLDRRLAECRAAYWSANSLGAKDCRGQTLYGAHSAERSSEPWVGEGHRLNGSVCLPLWVYQNLLG